MTVPGLFGGSFLEPTPWDWLFGAGIGTNIGASIIWGFLAGFVGYLVAKRLKQAWRGLHAKLDRHRELTEELHYLAHHGEPHPRVARRHSGQGD